MVHGCGFLFYGYGFTGQAGFFHFQVHGFEDPHVRRHVIAGLQQYKVAHHQLAAGNGLNGAAADDFGVWRGHFLQGFQRLLSFRFLEHPQDRIEYDNGHDHQRIGHFTDNGADEAGGN